MCVGGLATYVEEYPIRAFKSYRIHSSTIYSLFFNCKDSLCIFRHTHESQRHDGTHLKNAHARAASCARFAIDLEFRAPSMENDDTARDSGHWVGDLQTHHTHTQLHGTDTPSSETPQMPTQNTHTHTLTAATTVQISNYNCANARTHTRPNLHTRALSDHDDDGFAARFWTTETAATNDTN